MLIVKLHSNLQTQLNFSWSEKELTLLSFVATTTTTTRIIRTPTYFCQTEGPMCLVSVWKVSRIVSGRYRNCVWFPKGVWKVSGLCWEGIRRVSRRSPEGVCKVSYLIFSRRKGLICLEGVWKVSVSCPICVCKVSGLCLVCERCLEGIRRVSGKYLEGV